MNIFKMPYSGDNENWGENDSVFAWTLESCGVDLEVSDGNNLICLIFLADDAIKVFLRGEATWKSSSSSHCSSFSCLEATFRAKTGGL